jgi:FSR family fosmidomycin resistance protein-like MFS transporter
LALGHLCSDLNHGTLSAILPFLIASYHYNYATVATLVMVSNIVNSVIQPVSGDLADKRTKPYIMTIGVLLAGGGMALTGFITNFLGLFTSVMISGIGIAMFHPPAAQLVNRSSDEKPKDLILVSFHLVETLGSHLAKF